MNGEHSADGSSLKVVISEGNSMRVAYSVILHEPYHAHWIYNTQHYMA